MAIDPTTLAAANAALAVHDHLPTEVCPECCDDVCDPCVDALRAMLVEANRLSAEVRRLTPAPKVARWEPMRNPDNGFALRGGKARASQKPRTLGTYTLNGSLVYAFVGGKGESFFYEEHARAHIEAWAKGKGWTVQHDA